MHLNSKDNTADRSHSLTLHVVLLIFPSRVQSSLLNLLQGAPCHKSPPSELNGHWFKMKSERRCEVNEFHTSVSLKTPFWLSSHSDWGWHVGNCAMLILHRKKACCSVMHSHTCLNSLNRDVHELRHCAFISFLQIICGWPIGCELLSSVTPHPGTYRPHTHKHIYHIDSWSMLVLIVFLLLE